MNSIWKVYGEEFITSCKVFNDDVILLDPWNRRFLDESLADVKTIELPEKHCKISTTVHGKSLMCNIYFRSLRSVIVVCDLCLGKTQCIECNRIGQKEVWYPQNN